LSLTLSTLLSNQVVYGVNAPLSKCTMTTNITSDGFSMLEQLLRTLITSLGGTYQDPHDTIKSLVAKNKESLFSFHTKAVQIQNQLKLNNLTFAPNKLLTRYLHELSRKQRGDNEKNLYGKTINNIFQSFLFYPDTKILSFSNAPISR